ncbi:hypothetical protein ACFV9G_13585 [Nocardioides sp. NPDC059952]|uniref:hypothetical protein n=1 Tax=Nocardioides sp. NPDC059952 TaxID=3347014 RepID=UPI00364DF1A7
MNNDELLVDTIKKLVNVTEGLAARVQALEDEFAKRDKAAAKARRDRKRSF